MFVMTKRIESSLKWYNYRVWVWRGSTVVPYIGDVLANDEDGAEEILVTDLLEGENIAEKLITYKGTFTEYEAYQKQRIADLHVVDVG